MRIQIEPHADLRAAPRSLFRGERRIDIIEIMDRWYGPDYRYVKVRRMTIDRAEELTREAEEAFSVSS